MTIEPKNTTSSNKYGTNTSYSYDTGSKETEDEEEEKRFNKVRDVSDGSKIRVSKDTTPSGSVLDKLQDCVEQELYGKSRAMVRRQQDSMIDNSSVSDHNDANNQANIE